MGIANITFSIIKRDSLITIINLFTSIVIARKLGLEALGIWSILRIISSYLECFGRTKADESCVYFLAKNKVSPEDSLANLIFINTFNILIIYFLVILNYQFLYSFFFKQVNSNYAFEFNLILFSVPFIFFYTSFCYFFQGIEDFFSYNRIIIINSLSTFFLILFFLYRNLELWWIVLVYLISPSISCLYAIYRIRRKKILKGKIKFKIIFAFIKYSFQFYINGIISQIYISGTNLIAINLISPAYIGLITQAQKFAELVYKFISPLDTPLYPKISQLGSQESKALISRAFRISCILVVFITLLISLLIRPLILLLYGQDFLKISIIFYILMPGIIFENIILVFKTYCKGIGKAIVVSYLQIIPLFLQIIVVWVLVKKFGYIGVPLSNSIGLVMYGISFVIWFKKNTRISFKELIPVLNDFILLFSFIKKNGLKFLKI